MGSVAAAGAALAVWLLVTSSPDQGVEGTELCALLRQNRVTRVFSPDGARLHCPEFAAADVTPALEKLLHGQNALGLRDALLADKGSAVAVTAKPARAQRGASLQQQLAGYRQIEGMRALALTPRLAVYAPRRELELSLRERDALAYVARALLRGAREPSLNAFPPALRRVERVEVMVMLRERGEPRLWRSARGTSLARALLTASRVARDRWHERESAMGGSLVKRLLDLDVEVSLLSEEGSLFGSDQTFIDRATQAEHGIGFEYGASWHYVLPEDMQRRGKGSAQRALLGLLSEQGLSSNVLTQSAFRAYRFVALLLGVSRAPLGAGSSPG